MRSAGTEDAIDAACIETETTQLTLQCSDVVASHVRRRQLEQAVAECPTGFDQNVPRGFVADSRNRETAGLLKVSNSTRRSVAVGSNIERERAEYVRESALKVADWFAALSRG